jgi:retinol dehydrogenase 12
VAAEIADREQRIDVLINNAGALFARRRLTPDGLEFTCALNHMAYFALTEGLRERLIASRPARIISTASGAHQDARNCAIFTRELARRLHGTGVTANCLHPGFVATRFGDQSGGSIAHLLWFAKFFAISPAQGAETMVYLASSPDVATITGQYYYKLRPTTPSAAARNDRSALLLWQRSAELAGMKENGVPAP